MSVFHVEFGGGGEGGHAGPHPTDVWLSSFFDFVGEKSEIVLVLAARQRTERDDVAADKDTALPCPYGAVDDVVPPRTRTGMA